jgi:hypothetical protein
MEKNVDIQSFRRTPAEKRRLWLNDLLSSFSHRGWLETDAKIEDCTATKPNFRSYRAGASACIGGYVVGLTYEVDGKRYDAGAISQVKVEKGETIKIRYNPRHPDQNNSIISETSWASSAVRVETILLVILMLGLLAAGIMMRK